MPSTSTRAASFFTSNRSRAVANWRKPQCSLDLQCFTHHIVTLHVLGRGNPDPCAGARPAFEKPFDFQPQERLRNGKKAHAELGGEFPARNDLSQTNGAAEDPLANDGVCFCRQTGLLRRVTHVRSPSVFPC